MSSKIGGIREVLKEVFALRDKYFQIDIDSVNGNELSRDQLRLSILMIYLGKVVADSTKQSNLAYSFRKFTQATKYKKLRNRIDSKVKDAEMDVIILIQKQVTEEINGQYKADVLKTLYDDCSRLVMSIQSRLNHLKNEAFSSRKGNYEG